MNILTFESNFEKKFLIYLKQKIIKPRVNIFLTGGNTFRKIYYNFNKNWSHKNKKYFLTDERFVNLNHKLSNMKMIKENFFKNIDNRNFNFINISKNLSKNQIIKSYQLLLPKKIDLIFLSMGEDGHIASIFSKKNKQINKKVFFDQNTQPNRISIGTSVIKKSKLIILVIKGKKRGIFFNNYLNSNVKKNFVISLLKNPLIFLDKKAYSCLNSKFKKQCIKF